MVTDPGAYFELAEALIREQRDQILILRAERDEARQSLREAIRRFAAAAEGRISARRALLNVEERMCEREGCRREYLPAHPKQKFCSYACKCADNQLNFRKRKIAAAA